MKITRLEIKDYRQFKNFNLDLTYPEGHEKAGQPLEKVCFIGQSGTGKTTLLKLMMLAVWENSMASHSFNDLFLNDSIFPNNHNIIDFEFDMDGNRLERGFDKHYHQVELPEVETPFINYRNSQELRGLKLDVYFFPAESEGYFFSDNQSGAKMHKAHSGKQRYFIFEKTWADEIWDEVFTQIKKYKEEEAEFRLKLSYEAEDKSIDFKAELDKWRTKAVNPLQDIADNCLDKILKEFRLKTKIKIDSLEELKTFQIETIDTNKTIPFSLLSTGIRQVITSAIPLFVGKLDEAIVFMDEPEISLFPDIQRMLIPYYTSFSDNSQWFFATHSPIIASQFDPAERIILDFNNEGKVTWRRGLSPEGDDPNDLLVNDFGMKPLLPEKGQQMYEKYLDLKGRMRFEKDPVKKEKLAVEFMKIGSDYGFGDEKSR